MFLNKKLGKTLSIHLQFITMSNNVKNLKKCLSGKDKTEGGYRRSSGAAALKQI